MDRELQLALDIAKKAAEYGRATNWRGRRYMTASLDIALRRLDTMLIWDGDHPNEHARIDKRVYSERG